MKCYVLFGVLGFGLVAAAAALAQGPSTRTAPQKGWQTNLDTARALARIPADAGLVQVVDPRNTVNVLLTGAPAVTGLFSRRQYGFPLIDAGDLPHAGAVTAALYLQEFVEPDIPWAHLDVMAWNQQSSHGRPEGQAGRAEGRAARRSQSRRRPEVHAVL